MAEGPADDKRLCPTRTSGASSLIAQLITPDVCLERQRGSYHKCFTCQYQGLSAVASLSPPPKPTPLPLPKRSPVTEKAPARLGKRAKVPKTA